MIRAAGPCAITVAAVWTVSVTLSVAATAPHRFLSDDCLQKSLKFGAEALRSFKDVCCVVPQSYAEPAGSLDEVPFWSQLNASGNTTFYDARCGKPLFRGPVGRTPAAFKAESQAHGWPSFRDAEVVFENVEVREGGEVVSKCGTHLGHNIPDEKGNRYCIDLLCIAGSPPGGEQVTAGSGAQSKAGEWRQRAEDGMLMALLADAAAKTNHWCYGGPRVVIPERPGALADFFEGRPAHNPDGQVGCTGATMNPQGTGRYGSGSLQVLKGYRPGGGYHDGQEVTDATFNAQASVAIWQFLEKNGESRLAPLLVRLKGLFLESLDTRALAENASHVRQVLPFRDHYVESSVRRFVAGGRQREAPGDYDDHNLVVAGTLPFVMPFLLRGAARGERWEAVWGRVRPLLVELSGPKDGAALSPVFEEKIGMLYAFLRAPAEGERILREGRGPCSASTSCPLTEAAPCLFGEVVDYRDAIARGVPSRTAQEDAIIRNANYGGENSHRGFALGAVLGFLDGFDNKLAPKFAKASPWAAQVLSQRDRRRHESGSASPEVLSA